LRHRQREVQDRRPDSYKERKGVKEGQEDREDMKTEKQGIERYTHRKTETQ
jgi:hypothetical protein